MTRSKASGRVGVTRGWVGVLGTCSAGANGDRVRFQVKAKAARQLWKPRYGRPFEYSLGWRKAKKLPSYFEHDFPNEVYGECEATGHRCDFFLLAWRGPNLVTGENGKGEQQSNPENYDYFVVPSAKWPGAKKVLARQLFENCEPICFSEDRYLEDAAHASHASSCAQSGV